LIAKRRRPRLPADEEEGRQAQRISRIQSAANQCALGDEHEGGAKEDAGSHAEMMKGMGLGPHGGHGDGI